MRHHSEVGPAKVHSFSVFQMKLISCPCVQWYDGHGKRWERPPKRRAQRSGFRGRASDPGTGAAPTFCPSPWSAQPFLHVVAGSAFAFRTPGLSTGLRPVKCSARRFYALRSSYPPQKRVPIWENLRLESAIRRRSCSLQPREFRQHGRRAHALENAEQPIEGRPFELPQLVR